jgi:hypothetical protein
MKITANLSISIKLKNGESADEAHERVIEKLIEVCDEWIQGEALPKIVIKYELDSNEYPTPNQLLN